MNFTSVSNRLLSVRKQRCSVWYSVDAQVNLRVAVHSSVRATPLRVVSVSCWLSDVGAKKLKGFGNGRVVKDGKI